LGAEDDHPLEGMSTYWEEPVSGRRRACDKEAGSGIYQEGYGAWVNDQRCDRSAWRLGLG
jgi:hypothetical protein